MGDSFSENILSGKVMGRVANNAIKNMTTGLFLVSIDAQTRAPIGPTNRGGGRLRSNMQRGVYMLSPNVFVGEFVFRQPYAEIQHDSLRFNHPRGGQAKYAENAMRNNRAKLLRTWGMGLLS